MEDRWFVFFEDDWLIFCRSWSGAWIYGIHLVPRNDGAAVDRSWASRDPEHYQQSDIEADRATLKDAIGFVLDYDESDQGWW